MSSHDASPIGLDPRLAVSVARQPILDSKGQIFGHELLYRHSLDATACTAPGNLAGARTLSDAVLSVGLDALTCGLPAFINLTRQLLLDGAGTLLPKEVVVLELREDIPVDQEVMDACRRLQADGYALALDDFTPGSEHEALLPFVQYVKIDVLQTPESQWQPVAARMLSRKLRLVAEKVETFEVAAVTKAAGYEYFQGYFFCRPTTFAATPLPARRLAYVQLLAALSRENLSLSEIEDLVKQDLSLSYRILRSINSAAFGLQREITSIRGALVLLGVGQVRKWASVWAMAGLSGGEAPGAVSVALVRARCCERIGELLAGSEGDGFFLLGLCSLLDVLLRRPMQIAISDMPLPAALRDALLGSDNRARATLDTVIAYEQGRWDAANAGIERLGIRGDVLPAVYADAIRWARELAEFATAA